MAADGKLDLERLLRMLPHRYPFLLIDRVLEFEGERAVTLKNVTSNEPFFAGHFPGMPIMPGVLIVEALAQSAAILALGLIGERRSLFMLTGIDKVRLRRRVVPGDQLKMEVRLLKHHHPLWKMRAEARVDGELAAEAELSAMEVEGATPIASRIHPAAVIDSHAEIDPSAVVGPGAVIGAEVRIGPDTVIGPYAVIEGRTVIGARNQIFQFASIGAAPQDLKYRGEPSRLEIGDDNKIREFTTIHRGTEGGGMVTRIGSDVLLMNYVHVAHDCAIGDHSIIANSTEIAGHCVLEEWVVTAGMCGIHQFSRIGGHAIVAAGSKVAQDVPPYSMVAGGDRARLVGVNTVGLERRGFSAETIAALKGAFRTLFYGKLLRDDAIKQVLEENGNLPEVRRLVDFIIKSERGVVGRDRE